MIHRIHELVWGPWLLVLFLGIGIIYTVKSGFFQIRRLPYWWKMTIGSIREEELEEEGAVTKFQTACTALAATMVPEISWEWRPHSPQGGREHSFGCGCPPPSA